MASKEEESELRNILLQDYALAARHYAWAVGELNRQRAVLSREHYQDLYRMVEDAREDCERLRKALAELRD